MAVYAISDLHLALSIDKPMDVFGGRWSNYMERLKTSWEKTVLSEDYVVIPGDISWATYLEQAYEDFSFINRLPGIKIISKGNHDYWWTTLSKLQNYIGANGFSTIRFMHNNSFSVEGMTLCGTRGWKCPGDDDFTDEDRKIYTRELQRLELSLKSTGNNSSDTLIAALHYPPFNSRKEPSEFVDIMHKYNVKTCLYGHLHGESSRGVFNGVLGGTDFRLVSADYLGFTPLKIFP
jgi:predicted phosphohydrolase